MRGLLLAFEGLDKTGKTSQCKLLYSHLKQRGIQAHLIHFPVRDSTTGVVINRYLKN
jgi:dTMP kinase